MILEGLAVCLELYGEGLENEGLDTFDAIGVNTMAREVPGSAAARLGEAADLLARRPSEALPGRHPTPRAIESSVARLTLRLPHSTSAR